MLNPVSTSLGRAGRPAISTVFLLAAFVIVVLAGCAKRIPPGATPEPSLAGSARLYTFSAEESLAESHLLDIRTQGLHSWMELEHGLRVSLEYLKLKPQNRPALTRMGPTLTWGQLAVSVEDLLELLPLLDRRPELLAERFLWFELKPDPRMTSYYTPELEASPTKAPGYGHAVYKRPPDLCVSSAGIYRSLGPDGGGKTLPYHTREDVELSGVLDGKGLELAWVRDELDLYDLHLEGCGRLRFPDGSSRDVVYAASNGYPFTALSQVLKREGYLPPNRLGKKDVREFFDKHPSLLPRLLAENKRYVFFEYSDDGPRSAMGKALTPMVSVATDPKVLPLGSMLILDAGLPDRQLRGLVLAQDTGSAIKGSRLDFYAGVGRVAGELAQRINTPVRVYLLVSRAVLR